MNASRRRRLFPAADDCPTLRPRDPARARLPSGLVAPRHVLDEDLRVADIRARDRVRRPSGQGGRRREPSSGHRHPVLQGDVHPLDARCRGDHGEGSRAGGGDRSWRSRAVRHGAVRLLRRPATTQSGRTGPSAPSRSPAVPDAPRSSPRSAASPRGSKYGSCSPWRAVREEGVELARMPRLDRDADLDRLAGLRALRRAPAPARSRGRAGRAGGDGGPRRNDPGSARCRPAARPTSRGDDGAMVAMPVGAPSGPKVSTTCGRSRRSRATIWPMTTSGSAAASAPSGWPP